MAARSRPRGGDADEVLPYWNLVRQDAKRTDALIAKSDELSRKIVELADKQGKLEVRGELPDEAIDKELEAAIRDNLATTEEIHNHIHGGDVEDPDDDTLLGHMRIIKALRQPEHSTPKNALPGAGKLSRGDRKRKHGDSVSDDRDSIATDSPGGPSPKAQQVPNPANRLINKSQSRAGSVPAVREASVKAEEEDDRDSLKGAPLSSNGPRLHLSKGTEVFYRNTKSKHMSEGEGILCQVTSVIGDGKQRRYEVVDMDPEPPAPAQPYRASVNHLVPIPKDNKGLPLLSEHKQVLAMYPGTNTFYKAHVVSQGRENKDGIKEEKDEKSDEKLSEGMVQLKFEGEDELEKLCVVERRYVLPDNSK